MQAIEPQATLAHIGHELDRRVARASRGLWWLANRADLRQAEVASFSELVEGLQTLLPERREPGTSGPMRQGVLATGDPRRANHCMGLAVVATSAEGLSAALLSAGLDQAFAA